jgi:uncharacterized damage-inducible protein DinB
MLQTEQGDSSVLTWLFGHHTWADLRLLEFCEGLSDAQLDTTVLGTYGSIRATLVHFIHSEVDYVNLATEKWPEVIPPEDRFVGFAVLEAGVRWAGDELLQLALAARAGTIVRVERPQEPVFEYPLTGFMAQVLHHSSEHRTQIATILTHLGLVPPNLSGWQYMRERGELREFA